MIVAFASELCETSFGAPLGWEDHIQGNPKPKKKTERKRRRVRKTKSIPFIISQFQCHICKIHPKTLRKMKQHLEQHVAARDKKCEICDEQLTSNELKLHLCGTEVSLKCDFCTRLFNVTSDLLQHLTSDHDNKILHKCRKCNRFFGIEYLRDLHERLHKKEYEYQQKPFACEICSKRYKHKATLHVHMLHHTGESEYHGNSY